MILVENEKNTQRTSAVIAGSAMLIMAVCAGYVVGFVNSHLIVKSNTSATITNFIQSQGIFGSGILGWLIILICDVLTAWALFHFLTPVSKELAQLSAWFRLLYCAILSIAVTNLIYIQILVSNLNAQRISTSQAGIQILLCLDLFQKMWSLGLILFGLHLLLVGILILRSGFIPKILGILLLLTALSYMSVQVLHVFLPQFEVFTVKLESVLSLPMALGELVFAFWLLISGGRITD